MGNVIKLVLGFVFVVGVMLLGYRVATDGGEEDYLRMQADLVELRAGNAALQEVNAALALRIEALRSDPRAIERSVRDELGMVRRDELVILLNRPERSVR